MYMGLLFADQHFLRLSLGDLHTGIRMVMVLDFCHGAYQCTVLVKAAGGMGMHNDFLPSADEDRSIGIVITAFPV